MFSWGNIVWCQIVKIKAAVSYAAVFIFYLNMQACKLLYVVGIVRACHCVIRIRYFHLLPDG